MRRISQSQGIILYIRAATSVPHLFAEGKSCGYDFVTGTHNFNIMSDFELLYNAEQLLLNSRLSS